MRGQPSKKQLPGDLRQAFDAMTDEAPQAASHKLTESGRDPSHGGVSLAAGEFDGLLRNADRMIDSITERATAIAEERASTTELVEQLRTILRESTEISQKMTTLGTQAARQESIATKQLIAARQAFAETEAVATKAKEVEAEIDAGRDAFKQATAQVQRLVAATETAAKAQREADAKRSAELIGGLSAEVAKAGAAHQAALTKQLQEFTGESEAAVAGFATESATSLAAGNDELKRLVAHLDELEDQVEKAMERATGASLFQAFQRRQLDMLGAKKFWGTALALSVVVLLAAVGYFVYSLPFVTAYDAAFYTRLSIVIPLTGVVGFCGFRYSRERKRAREFNESLPPSLQTQAG